MKIDEKDKIKISEFDFQQFNRETIAEYAAKEKAKNDLAKKKLDIKNNETIIGDNDSFVPSVSGFEPIEEHIEVENISFEPPVVEASNDEK